MNKTELIAAVAEKAGLSKKDADAIALDEFSVFRVRQDREYVGDFEREISKLEKKLKRAQRALSRKYESKKKGGRAI